MNLLRLFAVFWLLLATGCGDGGSPEHQLRQTLNAMQQAAESRKINRLMDFVSDDYRDSAGRGKKEVRALAQLQFIRNPKIHTFKSIKRFALDDDNQASVSILVALAGRPIDNASALSGLRAELMQFDLEFIYDDEWKLIRASWRPAQSADFL